MSWWHNMAFVRAYASWSYTRCCCWCFLCASSSYPSNNLYHSLLCAISRRISMHLLIYRPQKMNRILENDSIWSEIAHWSKLKVKCMEKVNEMKLWMTFLLNIHSAMIFFSFSPRFALHSFQCFAFIWIWCFVFSSLMLMILFLLDFHFFVFLVSFSCKFENNVRYINCVTSYWRQF